MSRNTSVGTIIKHIIPSDMTVTEAAKILGISRPALSNVLNGNAELSISLACKIEDVFRYKALALLEYQLVDKYQNYRQKVGSTVVPTRDGLTALKGGVNIVTEHIGSTMRSTSITEWEADLDDEAKKGKNGKD